MWTWLYELINGIAFREEDHCRKSHLKELKRCREKLERFGYAVLPEKEFATLARATPRYASEEEEKMETAVEVGLEPIQDIADRYFEEGEKWALDQRVYMIAVGANKKWWSQALDTVDIEAMVSYWSDETIRTLFMRADWSNLAFTKEQNRKIWTAVDTEHRRRFPVKKPSGMGMGRDGTQA